MSSDMSLALELNPKSLFLALSANMAIILDKEESHVLHGPIYPLETALTKLSQATDQYLKAKLPHTTESSPLTLITK